MSDSRQKLEDPHTNSTTSDSTRSITLRTLVQEWVIPQLVRAYIQQQTAPTATRGDDVST